MVPRIWPFITLNSRYILFYWFFYYIPGVSRISYFFFTGQAEYAIVTYQKHLKTVFVSFKYCNCLKGFYNFVNLLTQICQKALFYKVHTKQSHNQLQVHLRKNNLKRKDNATERACKRPLLHTLYGINKIMFYNCFVFSTTTQAV